MDQGEINELVYILYDRCIDFSLCDNLFCTVRGIKFTKQIIIHFCDIVVVFDKLVMVRFLNVYSYKDDSMNTIIMKGYGCNQEYYAIRKTVSPQGNPTNIIVEVEPSEKIRAEYKKQQSKFTKRKDWKNDRGFY